MRSYEQVKAIFKENGCELLETEYKDNKTKMRYIAQCGHEHEITFDNFRAGKGRLCKACRYKQLSKKYTYDYEYVRDYFEKEGCKLISTEYVSANTKMKYIAQCGHENEIKFTKFVSGGGRVCVKCSKSKKYTFDEVFSEFEKRGCTLLECSYKNCKTPMRYIATCGHESEITFDELLNAKGVSLKCRKCQQYKHLDIEDARKLFDENGCKLLTDNFKRQDEKLDYIASCGHPARITLQKFMQGQGRKCNKCCMPKGSEHHAYNPNLTDEDRKRRDMMNGEIKKIRNKAFERDNYTCQICGDNKGGNLEAHHIDGWDNNIEKRFELSNLITLCEKCHKGFHKEYGYGNNTKEQFNAYLAEVTQIPRA